MSRLLKTILLVVSLLGASAKAQVVANPADAGHRIPFREASSSAAEEVSFRWEIVVLLLVAGAGGALWLGRKRLPAGLLLQKGVKVRLDGRLTLSTRSAVYRIEADERIYLVATQGDRLIQLDPALTIPATTSTEQAGAKNAQS